MNAHGRRSLRTWILYAGVALVVGGLAYRGSSMVAVFSIVGTEDSPENKSAKLAAAIGSTMVADQVIAVGGLLIAGTLGALIAQKLSARRSPPPQDHGD
jgi:hypothetical protein